jgi:hypothetical protein
MGKQRLQRIVGGFDAAQVGDVLDDDQLAVDEQSGKDLDLIVLGYERSIQGLESPAVSGRPPIGQVPVLIELGPRKIEPVGDLVPNSETGSSII